MSAKRSVVVSDSLLAEARRAAGVRTSAAAVNAALREFVGRRGRNGAAESAGEKSSAKKKDARRGGAEDFAELVEYMRESGWDGFDYKARRRNFGRRFDGVG